MFFDATPYAATARVCSLVVQRNSVPSTHMRCRTTASLRALLSLKAERQRLECELAATGEAPKVVSLHPATVQRYLQTVEHLAATIGRHAASKETKGNIVADLRALIDSVTIYPMAPRKGFEIEVKGRLAALIGGAAFPTVGKRVVAEVRYSAFPNPWLTRWSSGTVAPSEPMQKAIFSFRRAA